MSHPFRRKNLSPRLVPLYALTAAAFALAAPTPGGFAVGGGLVAAGMGLRVWGAGHLVKTNCLTVTGPYAHLRHPLYAGTMLVGIGFAIIAGGAVAAAGLLLLPPFFLGYYLPYKERIESARLERRHGAAYGCYRAAVRPLLPSFAPWRSAETVGEESWSAERFADNSEVGTVLGVSLALALLALRAVLPG